jgi:sortase A
MHMRAKRLISAVLLVFAAFLLGRGAREFLESRWAQSRAAKEFQQSKTPAVPRRPQLGETVAKLSIPRLGAEIFVVEGTDDKDLRMGPGHMPGTAMPGQKGNCVIAGHRDTHFRILRKIRHGDEIALETKAGRFVYTVDGTQIVKPTNVSSLQPTEAGVLHLITCYPFYYVGNAPKRFIVHAKLDDAESAEDSSPHRQAAVLSRGR